MLYDFDDVLIEPVFSNVRSRKDVDLTSTFLNHAISLPVINSNMDTIASVPLCRELSKYGMMSSLHRFWSIEENVKAFTECVIPEGLCPMVSIGVGEDELERANALRDVGATHFILDVAHAANIAVVETYNKLLDLVENPKQIIVGDFGNSAEIHAFLKVVRNVPGAIKVGIGIGSVCHTRLVTGVGSYPISCLQDCAEEVEAWNAGGYPLQLILDGGVKHVGDIAKALVAGADIVMSGSLFAGTDEASGRLCLTPNLNPNVIDIRNGICGEAYCQGGHKEYRGSASLRSYEVQGKVASWRAPEGTTTWIPRKGPVRSILDNINGGLRSSCSYVNAFNLDELKANGKLSYVR